MTAELRTFIASQHNALHRPTCHRVKELKNPKTMKLTPAEVERSSFWGASCCWRYSATQIVDAFDWMERDSDDLHS